ncbi:MULTISPECIES: caspase family protein [unclassified Tolypothrix]|uniref:caspase family protein n=1 Tax=unclassified Tolypothrix TaxID=2649714 RepID=UPI0005EAA46A|nr:MULTISPECIES: caspase family protein [unclassified Tolypothrix]BAY88228.1 peptidase C14 caspase catalytic subunit p20 [Microchaete diplosiphon NIES-3275]EKF02103.1 ICE-like protease p20 domain protein [Tolypothrix sp. PCC 7601]MBE9085716.1 caspase family protein [Tolypothrix sp. LEGE 11397]UYD28931.1 caspase family protein [Tolypothrix sp. PCC 7712]UYD35156.1 caspase family protein [Tolypothrix sp. PCC 7601]
MKRRTFLQRIGSTLTVLGITEAEWLNWGNRYYQALAQPSVRKLALLIGINQYSQNPALSGCLTDVELQKELLMHRFGFPAANILTLTEEQANREFIEAAFLEHLGKQARTGDVVVFHFSGYGTRINIEADQVQNALIAVNTQNSQNSNYLLEETLLLLLRSLSTDRVTAVLDTSYYAPNSAGLPGLRVRSRPEVDSQLATAELEFLKQLKTQNSLIKGEVTPPLLLSATGDSQQAAREVLLSGFSAGLFTYALTQYLWEVTPTKTIQVSLSQVETAMRKLGSKQQPALVSSKKNPQAVFIGDNFAPDTSVGGEGAITAIEEDGKTVSLWLAGLPPQVLENYSINSRFSLVTGEPLILRSRAGLTAKAQLSNVNPTNPLQVGQLVQETVRVLPRNISLIVALDTALERIERVDATSAFASIAHVSAVVAGEQPADYLFGKLSPTPTCYSLFSLSGEAIPNIAGEPGEAVKIAVQRLGPKLPTLLAAKLWRLTENEGSSRLAIKASLEIINTLAPRVVMQRETMRTLGNETATNKSPSTGIVPIGSKLQYRLQNLGDRAVYLILLGLKNNRSAIAFYPWQTSSEPNISPSKPLVKQLVIAPGETFTLPQSAAAAEWVIPGPAYECEHQLIFSTSPFNETLTTLETAKNQTTDQQPIGPLLNPLEVAQALLQDLHNASSVKAEINGTAADSYVLDVNHWATLSFNFQVA